MLVTVSGLDGAGKSTLLHALVAAFEDRGRSTTVLTTYDHISLYSLVRRTARLMGRRGRPRPHAGDSRASSRGSLPYRIARARAVRRASFVGDLLILSVNRLWQERV